MTRETLRQAHWRCAMHVLAHWRCPKSWVYPQIIQFVWGFSTINHPASGVPPWLRKPPECVYGAILNPKNLRWNTSDLDVFTQKIIAFWGSMLVFTGGLNADLKLQPNVSGASAVMARGLFPCQQLGALRLGSAPWAWSWGGIILVAECHGFWNDSPQTNINYKL